MHELITRYIEARRGAWAASTLKSTASRLRAAEPWLNKNPKDYLDYLMDHGRSTYGIYTIFKTISSLEKWATNVYPCIGTPFTEFIQSHKNIFKHSYRRKFPNISFEDLTQIFTSLNDVVMRDTLLFLLRSGLRISEIYKVDDLGHVKGKGGKIRKVFAERPTKVSPIHRIRKELAVFGLKPHDLRKLFATKLVNSGLPISDVCHIMGWSSVDTALVYLQPKRDAELSKIIGEAVNV